MAGMGRDARISKSPLKDQTKLVTRYGRLRTGSQEDEMLWSSL